MLALPLSKLFHHLIFAFFEAIAPSLHHFIFVLVQLQKWDLAVTNLLAQPPRAPRGRASSRRTCVMDWTWGKLCQAGHHYWISWLIINSPLPQVLRGDTSVMWHIFMTHGGPRCSAGCSLPDSFLFYVWLPSSLAKCPWPQHICHVRCARAGLDVRKKSANVSLRMCYAKYGHSSVHMQRAEACVCNVQPIAPITSVSAYTCIWDGCRAVTANWFPQFHSRQQTSDSGLGVSPSKCCLFLNYFYFSSRITASTRLRS